MKKMRLWVGVALLLATITAIGLLSNGEIVKSVSAQYYGGCYFCNWDNGSQTYNCQVYDGPGGAFCSMSGGCHVVRLCLPAN